MVRSTSAPSSQKRHGCHAAGQEQSPGDQRAAGQKYAGRQHHDGRRKLRGDAAARARVWMATSLTSGAWRCLHLHTARRSLIQLRKAASAMPIVIAIGGVPALNRRPADQDGGAEEILPGHFHITTATANISSPDRNSARPHAEAGVSRRTRWGLIARISRSCFRATASWNAFSASSAAFRVSSSARVERSKAVVQLAVFEPRPEVRRLDFRRGLERLHRLDDVMVDGVRHAQTRPERRRVRVLATTSLQAPDVGCQIAWRDRMRISPRNAGTDESGRASVPRRPSSRLSPSTLLLGLQSESPDRRARPFRECRDRRARLPPARGCR